MASFWSKDGDRKGVFFWHVSAFRSSSEQLRTGRVHDEEASGEEIRVWRCRHHYAHYGVAGVGTAERRGGGRCRSPVEKRRSSAGGDLRRLHQSRVYVTGQGKHCAIWPHRAG